MKTRAYPPSRERGAVMVELAVALPLLLLLMLAVVEIGRMLMQYNTLTQATQDGARYLAANARFGSTGMVFITTELASEVGNLVAYGNVSGGGTPLLPNLSAANITVTDEGDSLVSVSVTWSYAPMLGGQLPTFRQGEPVSVALPLRASVVMRAL